MDHFYLRNLPYPLDGQISSMSDSEVRCCYCGSADDFISKEKSFKVVDRKNPVCRYCGISQCVSFSEEFGLPKIRSWMIWLMRNDPTHWNSIVAAHNTADTEIGVLIMDLKQESSS